MCLDPSGQDNHTVIVWSDHVLNDISTLVVVSEQQVAISPNGIKIRLKLHFVGFN
jgi:hypothetical protein